MNRNFCFLASILLGFQVQSQDLASDLFLSTSVFIKGESYQVNGVVQNIGNRTATNYEVRYYLSQDTRLDAADQLLITKPPVTTSPGSSFNETVTVKLPSTVNAGTYYLFIAADITNVVSETNEKNNYRYRTIKVEDRKTDLFISALSRTAGRIVPGGTVRLRSSETTSGNVPAGEHYINYYLSEDTLIGAADVLLWSSYIGKSYPGTQVYWPAPVIPAGTLPGHYYVVARSDARKQVKETNETNNTRAFGIEVEGPITDLAVTRFSASGPISDLPGHGFSTVSVVKNLGNTTIQQPSYKVYFSKDTIVSDDDKVINHFSERPLHPGDTSRIHLYPIIPANMASGTYYVLFSVSTDILPDQRPENNFRTIRVSVREYTSDLEVSTFVVSAKVTVPGTTIRISSTVKNNGEALTSTTLGYFLSSDSVLDVSDKLLDTTSLLVHPGFWGETYYKNILIDSSSAHGNYYLLAAADYKNSISESDEVNNTRIIPFTLKNPDTDLTVSFQDKGPLELVRLNYLEFTIFDKNIGTTAAGYHDVATFLSTDTILSEDDQTFFRHYSYGLQGGDSFDYQSYSRHPVEYYPGRYYLLAITDISEEVAETNENNNMAWLELIIHPDWTEYKNEEVKHTNLRTSETASTGTVSTISLYPNPTEGMLHFSTLAGVDVIEVTDVTGVQRLTVATSGLSQPEIDLSALGAGIFTVKLLKEGQVISINKVALR